MSGDNNSGNSAISIEPVTSARQLHEFVTLPWSLYRDDPNWVPPLLFEQKQRLSHDKNPFFKHATGYTWLARRNGRTVGRISAQVDHLYLQQHECQTGYFGMLEAEENQETVTRLMQQAEQWLRDNGMTAVQGPFNLSSNEECGLLVDGFETPPRIMMGHARRYYGEMIEAAGYRRAKDLLAYHVDPAFEAPKVMTKLAEVAARKDRVMVRSMSKKHLKRDLEIMRDVFNDAWSQNWGFVPFTEEEFADVGEMLTLLIDDDFGWIAEIDGRPVAFVVAFPNINQVIRDLNGRLLPFGWAKLLWRLKVKYPTEARVPLMGVRRQYHNTRLGPTLAFMVIDPVRKAMSAKGIVDVEMSWILENNAGMRGIIEAIGGVAYKRYRIYEKTL